ncbi:MAG: tellurite resistance TerB family protein, partial [Ideonella sp.]|nr:tellurite resistance TerB family protein [Ideonella sp.]
PVAAPPAAAPRTVNLLPAPEVEQHSQAMLKAMVAAAKSDGHLDERERGLLEAELQRLEGDATLRRWLETEIRKSLDPADVARAATSPEMAAEMYLASLLVADETTTMERLYLDELARQLKLPEGLKAQLEAQATAA